MATSLRQHVTTGSPDLARRVRGFFGLMAHIANLADVTRAHVSFVVSGQRKSTPLMRVILRELEKAESGRFRRAA